MHNMCKGTAVEEHGVLETCKQPSIEKAGIVTKEADGIRLGGHELGNLDSDL